MRYKTKRLLVEFCVVFVILAALTAFMIPKFLQAQNMNTPKNFPDPVFRSIVEQTVGVIHNGKISKNQLAQIKKIVTVSNSNTPFRNPILDLTGIELFTNLLELDCRGKQIKKLDLSRNQKLKILKCGHNNLTELDLSHNPQLVRLSCSHNKIVRLDISQATRLERLECSDNQLSELEIANCLSLTDLDCQNNMLSNLDVSKLANLTNLDISHNQFDRMPDLRNHKNLIGVDVEFNNLDGDDLVLITPLLDRFPGQWAVLGDRVRYGFLYSSQNGCNLSELEEETR